MTSKPADRQKKLSRVLRALEASYVAGYRKYPEDPEELSALERAGLEVIAQHPW